MPGGVSSGSFGPSGRNSCRSTPFGTTWMRAGSTPPETYICRTYSLGTQISSTFPRIGSTHSCGMAPNSQGWITARRADDGPKSYGH